MSTDQTMNIELSKTQTEALQSGAAHDAGHITLPATLRGGARQKVLASLIVAKLAAYRAGTLVITATGMAALGKTDAPSDQVAGYVPPEDEVVEQPNNFDAALGSVSDAAWATAEGPGAATAKPTENDAAEDSEPAMPEPIEDATQSDGATPATIEPTEAVPADSTLPAKPPRGNTKQARLIEMLKRPEGATIAEVVEALEWQAHTVRGAIAGALKKKLGLKVESEKVDAERGRVYRITE
jgi:hypothetical protein